MSFEAIWLQNGLQDEVFFFSSSIQSSLEMVFWVPLCGRLINSKFMFPLKRATRLFLFDLNYFMHVVRYAGISAPFHSILLRLLFFKFLFEHLRNRWSSFEFTIDVVHFFISAFIIIFCGVSILVLFSVFIIFTSHIKVVYDHLSTQYRKVNINLQNWFCTKSLQSIWMKSSTLWVMIW